MKGKTKSIYKIFVFMAVMLIASILVLVTAHNTKSKYVYADYSTEIADTEFSFVDDNHLIMSVEKVGVRSEGNFDIPLYHEPNSSGESSLYKNMLGREDKEYYYTDIKNEEKDKYVVHNGKYVMLENKYDKNIGYYNSSINAYNLNDSENINMQEAIMISFGQYVYDIDNSSVEMAPSASVETGWAGISYINVVAYRNGKLIPNDEITGVRQDNNNRYQDFVYLITQKDGNEGFYDFYFTYRYNGTAYTANFSIYVLYETTYEGALQLTNNEYRIEPTLSMNTDNKWGASEDFAYHYMLGDNSGQYPILTYDYTKYDLEYTHTSNGVVTTYDYDYKVISSTTDASAQIKLTKTSSAGKTEIDYDLVHYNKNASNNLVSIIFTEMGKYSLNFKYVYRGVNSENAPEINLKPKAFELAIHGFELKYSKVGHSEAQMRYLTFARGADEVDLIVPNGYSRDKISSDKVLGVAYSLYESTTSKIGTVLTDKTEEAKVGDFTNDSFDWTGLDESNEYVTTNQGSLWLSTNDSFVASDSYYYYSPAPFTNLPSDKNPLTNTVSFNTIGYYLVAIKVDPDGYKDTSTVDSEKYFYQYFAFQYESNTLNMNVVDAKDKKLGSGDYTNQEVNVNWEPAGVFERDITAKYYTVKDKFYSKEELLTREGIEIKKGVNSIDFADQGSYLIELASEGATTTYRMFTIDTTPISGIAAYAVEIDIYNNEKVYNIMTDINSGNPVKLDSSITNDLATLYWNNKESNAKITATYTFTPFVKNNIEIKTKKLSTEEWINTNYELGDTVGGFEINKVSNLISNTVEYKNVLYSQGIYIFTLTDAAGNSCKYMLIIDNTEAFFNVDGQYMTNATYMSNTDIAINVGTHKIINLSTLTTDLNTTKARAELHTLIKLLIENNYDNLLNAGYYIQYDSNISALNKMFATDYVSMDNRLDYIFKVANNSLSSYEGSSGTDRDNDSSISQIGKDKSTAIVTKSEDEGAASTLRRLYLLGANQIYTSPTRSKSYIMVEINTDNAKGMIFSSENIDLLSYENIEKKLQGDSVSNIYRRYPGGTSIGASEATSDKYLAFTWLVGSDKYEVVKVAITHYQYAADIDKSVFGEDGKNYYYYDSSTANTTILYNKADGTKDGSVTFDDTNSRGVALIKVANQMTTAGLYKITRSYGEDYDWTSSADADKQEYTYYIIVDRNGIIVGQDTVNGGNINVGLLEGETTFNTFSSIGGQASEFTSEDGEFNKQYYNIYLNTNKLPAVLNIPLYKYFYNISKSSDYKSGSLDVKLYFKDTYNQLENSKVKTIKLFDSTNENYTYTSNKGYFSFSIIQGLSANYKAKFTHRTNIDQNTSIEDDWLCLQGDYILVIRDNVKGYNSNFSAEKIIGFRIQAEKPSVDIYSVINKNDNLENRQDVVVSESNKLILNTSDEFVKINLDEYVKDSVKAQVDLNYLMVKNETTGQYFISHEYANTGGLQNLNSSIYVNNNTVDNRVVSRIITLDTGLVRNADGSINVDATLEKQYTYTITVRFKLSVDGSGDRYKDCYYTINNASNGAFTYNDYYYQTYTIVIDRQAPTENVEYLSAHDQLLAYTDNNSVIDSAVYHETSGIYYVNQYANYFKSGNTSDIYVFVVEANSSFNYRDINKFYYKPINGDDLNSLELNLPITNLSGYNEVVEFRVVNEDGGYGSFGDLGVFNYGMYYEILELDKAGNMTQYVIYYIKSMDDIFENSDPNQRISIAAKNLSINLSIGMVSSANGVTSYNGTGNLYELKTDSVNTLFEVDEITIVNTADKFYRIELWNNTNGEIVSTIDTNLTTRFNDKTDLGAKVVSMINDAGLGNYTLKVVSRNGEVEYNINYLDKDNIVKLNIDSMLQGNKIVFGAANTKATDGDYYINYAYQVVIDFNTIDENGNTKAEKWIYTVITNDKSNPSNNFKLYSYGSYREQSCDLNINTTYVVTVKDPFNNIYTKRINLSGQVFETITIGDYIGEGENKTFEAREYYEHGNVYYTYHNALIDYDPTIYTYNITTLRLDNKSILNTLDRDKVISEGSSISGLKYLLISGYWGNNNEGGLLEAVVELKYNGATERTYAIVIDTRTGSVVLRDTSNQPQNLNVDKNQSYTSTSYDSATSGTMNLSWTNISNEYFNYKYVLHEFKLDGSIDSKTMTSTNCIINTDSDGTGKYVFEIQVYTKNNSYIGNKLYTFSVKALLNKLYSVERVNGDSDASEDLTVKSNASFKFFDDNGQWDSRLNPLTAENVAFRLLGIRDYSKLTKDEIPLYIYNQDLKVIVSNGQGANFTSYTTTLGNSTLTLYRVYTNTYSRYLGILRVEETNSILDSAVFKLNYSNGRLLEEVFKPENTLSYTVYMKEAETNLESDSIKGEEIGAVSISFNSYIAGTSHYLTKKDVITVDVYHNDTFVGTYDEFKTSNNVASLTILGSGKFTFVFNDIAGNTHTFTTNTGNVQNTIDVTILKEMVLTMNGVASINHAFYNDAVTLGVYNPSMYDLGSIILKSATRNGQIYVPVKSLYNYTFSDFGTYRVTLEAKFKGVPITKTIVFTIVNPLEARESIDLSSIGNYSITKVTNINDELVTDAFLNVINNNAVINGMYLTYERLLENADALGVTTGKQTFTITYMVNDYMYPSREVTFAFTLNNEMPTIECSLKSGESTTKEFTIKLNAGIVYEQVGESILYINDKMLLKINENSEAILSEIKITRDDYGTGDFFIRLESTSGDVIDSFKVEIKEPLNVWAIIVIVVVGVIVIAVVVTIILLRTRMRIR